MKRLSRTLRKSLTHENKVVLSAHNGGNLNGPNVV